LLSLFSITNTSSSQPTKPLLREGRKENATIMLRTIREEVNILGLFTFSLGLKTKIKLLYHYSIER
jgi:hypothetical protein